MAQRDLLKLIEENENIDELMNEVHLLISRFWIQYLLTLLPLRILNVHALKDKNYII